MSESNPNGNVDDDGNDDIIRSVQSYNKWSTEADDAIKIEIKTSKIYVVDLVGSERIKIAQIRGKRLQEGISINKGLFALGNVISSLGNESIQSKSHGPYKDSKLTQFLRGSLGGNYRILMIRCSLPSNSNKDKTVNIARYTNRAKNNKNHEIVNIDASSRVINKLAQSHAVLNLKDLLHHVDAVYE